MTALKDEFQRVSADLKHLKTSNDAFGADVKLSIQNVEKAFHNSLDEVKSQFAEAAKATQRVERLDKVIDSVKIELTTIRK